VGFFLYFDLELNFWLIKEEDVKQIAQALLQAA
jgi:hypothetical protein